MAVEPIVLDEYEAMLVPYENRESIVLQNAVGEHLGCTHQPVHDGGMYVHYHSKTHNRLVCACGLAVIVPNAKLPLVITADVFGPLRQWLKDKIERRRELIVKVKNAGEPPRWAPASVFDDDNMEME